VAFATFNDRIEMGGELSARLFKQLILAQQFIEILAEVLALAVFSLEVDSRRPKAARDRLLELPLWRALTARIVTVGGLAPETYGVETGCAPAIAESSPIPGALGRGFASASASPPRFINFLFLAHEAPKRAQHWPQQFLRILREERLAIREGELGVVEARCTVEQVQLRFALGMAKRWSARGLVDRPAHFAEDFLGGAAVEILDLAQSVEIEMKRKLAPLTKFGASFALQRVGHYGAT
jgi:hypothetical protein